jgi:Heparan-alpha-glucosaminide N-acetyltransferase, catalytic
MVSTASSGAAERVAELDLLRGLAALLMVFNHVGYAALNRAAAQEGVSGAIVFIGSMAPVLFFFATGFGGGLAARPGTWRSLADKVLLLLLADQFLGWTLGRPLGLDFFGFIAVSMVAARLVLATPRPVTVAALGIVAVLWLRYGLGQSWVAPPGGYGLVEWLIGATPHHGVSYPASPWLVYPLLGAALSVLHRRHGGRITPRAWMVVVAAIVVFALAAGMLASRGSSFHRWGSVGGGTAGLRCAERRPDPPRATPRVCALARRCGLVCGRAAALHDGAQRRLQRAAWHRLLSRCGRADRRSELRLVECVRACGGSAVAFAPSRWARGRGTRRHRRGGVRHVRLGARRIAGRVAERGHPRPVGDRAPVRLARRSVRCPRAVALGRAGPIETVTPAHRLSGAGFMRASAG